LEIYLANVKVGSSSLDSRCQSDTIDAEAARAIAGIRRRIGGSGLNQLRENSEAVDVCVLAGHLAVGHSDYVDSFEADFLTSSLDQLFPDLQWT
jgi:hypothetical protein